jgi:hypothetical protein
VAHDKREEEIADLLDEIIVIYNGHPSDIPQHSGTDGHGEPNVELKGTAGGSGSTPSQTT